MPKVKLEKELLKTQEDISARNRNTIQQFRDHGWKYFRTRIINIFNDMFP